MGNKIRLGDLLVRAGLITDNDLRVVLAQQKQHGGRLGEHLVRVNLCTDEQIARALARQLGLAFNDLSESPPAPVIAFIPQRVASRLQALAVSYEPRAQQLMVALSDPLDDDALAELTKLTGKAIVAEVASAIALRRAIEHAYTGVEVRDDGTSEFRLVDIYGREKAVRVEGREDPADEDDLPSLSTGELEPIHTGELQALQPSDLEEIRDPDPPPAASPRPRPAPKPSPAAAANPEAEEALRMVWSLAELLIERGYFTRAELMKSLRKA